MAWNRRYTAAKYAKKRAYARGFFAGLPKGEGTEIREAFGADYKSATPIQKMLRKSAGYRGKGAYWGKALGTTIGSAIGHPQWGGAIGNWASDKLEEAIKKRFKGKGLYGGQGSYTRNNALIAGGDMSMDVVGNTDETETITIRNCESIMDIYAPAIGSGSSPFASQKINVNPGLHEFSR